MKYIFLDIDGVLWTHRHMKYIHDNNLSLENRSEELDPICIENLKKLIQETNSMIVITSTWRLSRSIVDLKIVFEKFGLDEYIIDKTRRLYNSDGTTVKRGYEIDQFLKRNEILTADSKYKCESFVIIDDDSDMVHLLPYLVKTNMDVGLTKKHIKLAKQILNNKANLL